MRKNLSRRDFLTFLGQGAIALGATSMLGSLGGCHRIPNTQATGGGLKPLAHSLEDKLRLVDGLDYEVLIRWEDRLREGLNFGFNNDYLALVPIKEAPGEALLWVNHEYISPKMIHRFAEGPKTAAQVAREVTEVGGSVVHIKQAGSGWQVVPDSPRHHRVDASTNLPFAWPEPIDGSTVGKGTLGNCAGGYTPWGTILTCEENYDQFVGEKDYSGAFTDEGTHGWREHDPRSPWHYGWVVEIDPATGQGKKLIALGRCAHECATVKELPDGRCVVYTGDDKEDEFIYKFISDKPRDLTTGTLYVANTDKGIWIPVVLSQQPALQAKFRSQTEVLIHLREAGKLLGATPQNRPEDIEIDPITGHVLISMTMNKKRGNYHGAIMKLDEGGNYESLTFKADAFLTGGKELGFACPDNLAFDPQGGLWFTSDIAGGDIGKGEYADFGNNGLFYVPRAGADAGKVLLMATAPADAEFTGPCFTPDGKQLFLSVQHPGEQTKSLDALTSHWPDGGDSYPRSAVVVISGPLLAQLTVG